MQEQAICLAGGSTEGSNLLRYRVPTQRSSEGEFWQLWLDHYDHVTRSARRWVGVCDADVEEVVAITMMKAWNQVTTKMIPVINFKAWITRLLYTVSIDYHRYRKKRDEQYRPLHELEDHAGSPGSSPDTVLLDRELTSLLQESISAMPHSLSGPLLLRIVEEMTYAEISEKLSITPANSRKRVQLARKHLSTAVQHYVAEAVTPHAPIR